MAFLKDDMPQFYGDPAGGEVEVRQPRQRRAKKKTSGSTRELNIKETGVLSMKESRARLQEVAGFLSASFAAGHKNTMKAIASLDDLQMTIEKDMESRRVAYEAIEAELQGSIHHVTLHRSADIKLSK